MFTYQQVSAIKQCGPRGLQIVASLWINLRKLPLKTYALFYRISMIDKCGEKYGSVARFVANISLALDNADL